MLEARKIFAIAALLAVLISGALMQASVLRVYGIAPSLVLVCLVVCSFFTESIGFYALLVILAGWSVRVTPVLFDGVALATTALAFGVFWLQRRIVVKGLIGVSLLIGFTTIVMYAMIQPSFLVRHPGLMMGELLYNLLIGFVLFEIADRAFGRKSRA